MTTEQLARKISTLEGELSALMAEMGGESSRHHLLYTSTLHELIEAQEALQRSLTLLLTELQRQN